MSVGSAKAPENEGKGRRAQLRLVPSSNPESPYPRWLAVDLARGLAVMLMVLFHISYDLTVFTPRLLGHHRLPFNYWIVAPKIIASIFLLVVGISAHLRIQRKPSRRASIRNGSLVMPATPTKMPYRPWLLRGLLLLMLGEAITLSSYIFFPNEKIYFGILHCIGACVLLLPPFLGLSTRTLAGLGTVFFAVGTYMRFINYPTLTWVWLGIGTIGKRGADWYPVVMWFGMVLFGVCLGRALSPLNGSITRFRHLGEGVREKKWARFGKFLGKHSLLIYLIHQPLLVGFFRLVDIGIKAFSR